MNRHYYISDKLDDLERVELELQKQGIGSPQLHVFSREDTTAAADAHHLHEVTDFTKRDVIHSGFIGLGIGLLGSVVVLGAFHWFGWNDSPVGWMPAIFLAVIVIGFSTWVCGLRGIQVPNHEFTKFKYALDAGKHIFFIDVDSNQEESLREVVSNHPNLEFAGDGSAAPSWLVHGKTQFQRFIKAMP
ncbi:MAG: hypothetical protein ACJAUP_000515 [Cellvibrionaceae bacterium]|jgi:hypothetical protein